MDPSDGEVHFDEGDYLDLVARRVHVERTRWQLIVGAACRLHREHPGARASAFDWLCAVVEHVLKKGEAAV